MVGVICRDAQRPFVEEFFELFKTPWEAYEPGKAYDTVIATEPCGPLPDTRLVILSGRRSLTPESAAPSRPVHSTATRLVVQHRRHRSPVCRGCTPRTAAGEDIVYYGTKLRGASNEKAKKTFGFEPRRLEWLGHSGRAADDRRP